MTLRSPTVIRVFNRMHEASLNGKGLTVEQIQAMIPSRRSPFGVVWEGRRAGAKCLAIRDGKHVKGWKLESPPKHTRLEKPTPLRNVEFESVPDIFTNQAGHKIVSKPPVAANEDIKARIEEILSPPNQEKALESINFLLEVHKKLETAEEMGAAA